MSYRTQFWWKIFFFWPPYSEKKKFGLVLASLFLLITFDSELRFSQTQLHSSQLVQLNKTSYRTSKSENFSRNSKKWTLSFCAQSLYLENFWSKFRPPPIRLKVTPLDSARRDESNGITYSPIWENFLRHAWNPCSRLWSSIKLIVWTRVSSVWEKIFSDRGIRYTIRFVSTSWVEWCNL